MGLLFSEGEFAGLEGPDFEIYQPARWANNLHNLDRMRTKGRLLALGARLKALAPTLSLEATAEVPCIWNQRQVRDQWIYLLRSPAERKAIQPVIARDLSLATRIKDPAEHHQHILLCARLDHEGFEVGLRINEHATVDLENLLGRAKADPGPLGEALAALPAALSPPDLPGLRAAAQAARRGDAEWLWLGRRWPAADAIAAGAALAAEAAATVEALLPLYTLIAWTADNDHEGVEAAEDALAAESAEHKALARARAADEAQAREQRELEARSRAEARRTADEAWRKLQRALARPAPEPSAPERPAPERPAPERPAPERPRAPGGAGAKRPVKPAPAAPEPAATSQAAPAPAPRAPRPLAVGDRVRLTRGLLAGKEGVVRAQTAEGIFKIKVGALEMPIAATDLELM